MKKTCKSILFLIIIMSIFASILSGCSSNGRNNTDTQEKLPSFEANENMTEYEAHCGIYTWMSFSTKKYPENADVPKNRECDFELDICKNESESCQISLKSLAEYPAVSLVCESSYEGITVDLFEEYTVKTNNKIMYPDALVPLYAVEKTELKADTVKNYFIRFTTETDTEAGEYTYVLKLKTEKGTVLHTYSVTLVVHNVVLPETATLRTAVGLSIKSLAKAYLITATATDPLVGSFLERATEIYVKYYEFLLDHKISAIELPYDILDDRADKYMSDPRVTGFLVNTGVSDEKLKAYYDKLCTNEEWLNKAYAYPIDEPNTKEALTNVLNESERIRSICPKLKINGAFFTNIDYDGIRDSVDIMEESHDIICPKIANWNVNDRNYGCGIQDVLGTKGSFVERIKKMKENGMEIWSYVCVSPRGQYLNFMVDDPGINHRRIFWQQYTLGSTGFLYWSCNWWNDISDPWKQMNTVMWADVTAYGDGSLLYNGNKVGVDGACGSIRLEAFRDGIEDYDLIMMAYEVLGEKWINARVSRANSSVTSDNYLNTIRSEIIKTLSQGNGK